MVETAFETAFVLMVEAMVEPAFEPAFETNQIKRIKGLRSAIGQKYYNDQLCLLSDSVKKEESRWSVKCFKSCGKSLNI